MIATGRPDKWRLIMAEKPPENKDMAPGTNADAASPSAQTAGGGESALHLRLLLIEHARCHQPTLGLHDLAQLRGQVCQHSGANVGQDQVEVAVPHVVVTQAAVHLDVG